MKNIFKTTRTLVTIFVIAISFIVTSIANGNDSKKSDIVTTAVNAGSFNTLATALKAADLVEALKGDGPFTVFAPTDEAFAKLPEGTIEKLLNDKETLKKILLYHVVSGKVTSDQVVKLDKAETLAGQNVKIQLKDNKVMINNSLVTTVDVKTSNGVIHIIDSVLLPE